MISLCLYAYAIAHAVLLFAFARWTNSPQNTVFSKKIFACSLFAVFVVVWITLSLQSNGWYALHARDLKLLLAFTEFAAIPAEIILLYGTIGVRLNADLQTARRNIKILCSLLAYSSLTGSYFFIVSFDPISLHELFESNVFILFILTGIGAKLAGIYSFATGRQKLWVYDATNASAKNDSTLISNPAFARHELRGPVSNISSLAELISNTPLDKQQQNYIRQIQLSAEQSFQQIDKIVTPELVENDATTTLTDIKEAIREFEIYYQPLFIQHGNEIEFLFKGNDWIIDVDVNALKRALSIVLDHTYKTSNIAVKFEKYSAQIDPPVKQGYRVLITAPLSNTRLFKELAHDAQLKSYTQVSSDRKSNLILEFPSSNRFDYDKYAIEKSALKGFNVLIVDDNPRTLEIVKQHCSRWHIKSILCQSAREAIELLKANTRENNCDVDLVIADYLMPNGSGLELAESIRQLRLSKPIPFIIMSDSSLALSKAESQHLSIHNIIEKPILPPLLAECLCKALSPMLSPSEKLGLDIKESSAQRCLIIEDNDISREVLASLLSLFAMKVDSAASSTDALLAIQQQHYDLILIDIFIDELDGFTITKKLRQIEKDQERSPALVCAVTASNSIDIIHRSEDAGMNACLHKPVKIEDLKQLIKQLN